MSQEENLVVKEIMDYVKNSLFKIDFTEIVSFVLYRTNNVAVPNRYSTLPDGFPDLCGDLLLKSSNHAVPVYIEVKKHSAVCKDKEQLIFISNAKGRKCISFWANSLEDFKMKLRDFIIEIIYN